MIKFLFFSQILAIFGGGWVGLTESGKFQIFFYPFPYLINNSFSTEVLTFNESTVKKMI